jgi:transposase
VHDITQASALLDGVPAKCVVADKAYDAMALRKQIAAMPAKAVIPPRVNRRESIRWSKAVYRHRNLVERFFCRIKHFRRIATRYDKLGIRTSVAVPGLMTVPSSLLFEWLIAQGCRRQIRRGYCRLPVQWRMVQSWREAFESSSPSWSRRSVSSQMQR